MGHRTARSRLWLWGPPIVYMAAIFHFSSESRPLPELTAQVWDKLLHTIEYSGLALLLFRALSIEGFGAWAATILTVLIVSLYGGSDEWHQSFVPRRSADVLDWLTDTLAGAIGSASYWVFSMLSRPRRPPRR